MRDPPQDEVRKLFSVVTQDTHLFNTTIRQNLLIARHGASEDQMIKAARQAHIHDFIMSLPSGYDTELGEPGLRLSGDERQRLAIARALLKNAPILILDEPTSNLDVITHKAIRNELRSLIKERTTLLITHTIADLDLADEIFVLDNSTIAEHGSDTFLPQIPSFIIPNTPILSS